MASGLLALLDDVALIAKLAAASLDDVAAATAKAGAKSAGVVIDDAAVTPTYVTGFTPDRELPIIWKIAKGSLRNKLLFLLPGFLLLAAFLPQALTPLLMLGGAYLCFEAAEKVIEKLGLHEAHGADIPVSDQPDDRETQMVAGAIRTDLILSAEILAIALGTLGALSLGLKAAALIGVSIAVTALVYGAVAMIVKMDDVGVHMAKGGTGLGRAFGRGLVAGMPRMLTFLSGLGTAAMAWVGGGIVLHGMEETGILPAIPHAFHGWAHAVATRLDAAEAAVEWTANAVFSGIAGLLLGIAIVGLIDLARKARSRRAPAH